METINNQTTEDIKKRIAEESKSKEVENQKKINEIVPKFQDELNELCKKYGVVVESYFIYKDTGVIPGLRIKLGQVNEKNPYNRT